MAGLVFAVPPPLSSSISTRNTSSTGYATWRRADTETGLELPPEYARHRLDRLYRVDVAADGDGGDDIMRPRLRHRSDTASSTLDRRESAASTANSGEGATGIADHIGNEGPPFKLDRFDRLSLTLDESLIYPSDPPSTALYYLPNPVTTPLVAGSELLLQFSISAAPSADYTAPPATAETLYRIQRAESAQESIAFDITPLGQAKLAHGAARMVAKRGKGVGEPRWALSYSKFVDRSTSEPTTEEDNAERTSETFELQFKNGQWVRQQGGVVAMEERTAKLRMLVLQRVAWHDRALIDLLVAAWCARLWHKLAAPSRTMKKVSDVEGADSGDKNRRWNLVKKISR